MNIRKFWAPILLMLAASLMLACGSGYHGTSGRQLQSITINAFASGQNISFVATGTFSAAPITVSPLPVSWSLAPPPEQYALSAQPFTLNCPASAPGPVVASAPANPQAPTSGLMLGMTMISQSAPIECPL